MKANISDATQSFYVNKWKIKNYISLFSLQARINVHFQCICSSHFIMEKAPGRRDSNPTAAPPQCTKEVGSV